MPNRKFTTRDAAEDFIINNPHKAKTTQILVVNRRLGHHDYVVECHDVKTKDGFTMQYNHTLQD